MCSFRIKTSSRTLTGLLLMLVFFFYQHLQGHAGDGPALAIGGTFTGTVVSVVDGDSLLILHDGRELAIRLFGIDAPEYDQPGARLARRTLARLVSGQRVSFIVMDRDRYGRTVAQVLIGSLLVNEELIRTGMVWVYPRYCSIPRCDTWQDLQETARQRRFGIWQQKHPIAPWQWKRSKSAKTGKLGRHGAK